MKTFTSQNYRVVEPVYSSVATVKNPENPCFCAVRTKNCIAHSQSNSIIFFFWYVISLEKLNTNRTFVLNNIILLNYDFAFNIGQSNLTCCNKIVNFLCVCYRMTHIKNQYRSLVLLTLKLCITYKNVSEVIHSLFQLYDCEVGSGSRLI